MRIWLPFSLLTSIVWAAGVQHVLQKEPDEAEYPARKTLVTLLSEDEQFSLFLRACQRTRLIPLLNRLNGSTLFAPTNEAIERQPASLFTTKDGLVERDNLMLDLRETILYHVLNYTIIQRPSSNHSSEDQAANKVPPLTPEPKLYETLWHPTLKNETWKEPPTLPGTPSDPDPDWPRGRRGQLNWQGQLVRIARTSNSTIELGQDASGQGALTANVKKAKWASNGLLMPIDGVLQKPVNVSAQLANMPELSTFLSLTPKDVLDELETARHVTLFAPTNDAYNALSPLEMGYLKSGFAREELVQIVNDVTSQRGAGNNKTVYLEPLLRQPANGTLAQGETSLGRRPAIVAEDLSGSHDSGQSIASGVYTRGQITSGQRHEHRASR